MSSERGYQNILVDASKKETTLFQWASLLPKICPYQPMVSEIYVLHILGDLELANAGANRSSQLSIYSNYALDTQTIAIAQA